jgi:hypothetical protein
MSPNWTPASVVEVERQRRAVAEPLAPGRRLPAGLAQHPGPEREDRACLLRDRDELLRTHDSPVRVVPPQEALDRRDASAAELDLRLEGEVELVAPQALA